jgi:hypothetical protein
MAAPSQSSASVLNSWKEIACYLGRGVRTVQRYERDLNLPIRRPRGTSRSAVIALKEELDAWLRSTPSGDLQKIADSESAKSHSVHVVSKVHHSIEDAVELRNRCNALRTAHNDAISRLMSNVAGMIEKLSTATQFKKVDGGGPDGAPNS